MDYIIKAGSNILPAPTQVTSTDELLWSEDTGRTLAGEMIGDVIAEKKTISVKWEFLTDAEAGFICKNLMAGFFPVTFFDNGANTIEAYRSTITKEHIGRLSDGIYYYRSLTCDIVQK